MKFYEKIYLLKPPSSSKRKHQMYNDTKDNNNPERKTRILWYWYKLKGSSVIPIKPNLSNKDSMK